VSHDDPSVLSEEQELTSSAEKMMDELHEVSNKLEQTMRAEFTARFSQIGVSEPTVSEWLAQVLPGYNPPSPPSQEFLFY